MTVHEFGEENKNVVVLIHPALVMWDYFEYVIPLLEKAFNTDEYSEEDLQYIAKVLRFVSAKTVWRTFESCNNYKMPKDIRTDCRTVEYWYAQTEKKARKWDIDYIRKSFLQAVFKEFKNVGHGGLAALKPDLLVVELERVMGGKEEK